MGTPRLVTSKFATVSDMFVDVTTFQRDDQNYEGVWNTSLSSLLIFSGTQIAGSILKRFDGPIAGSPAGHPLYLVYWGSWWNGPGKGQLDALAPKLDSLMKSVYFSQLQQYGIPHAPRLAGSIVVTSPEPPLSGSLQVVGNKVVNLIDDLIDDDNLPDNTGSPKPLYMVLMPDTFALIEPTPGLTTTGEHPIRYDILSPFKGRYWVGWTRPEPANPDRMVQTLSHEIVETLTDPEFDGWRWSPPAGTFTEMSDGLWDGSGAKQTAYVNDALVESYWSNLHGAPIIPIDNDYAARLRATVVENGHSGVYEANFKPGPEGAPMCSSDHPACCFGDRSFTWTRFAVQETARVRMETRRYRTPVAAWRINDKAITTNGPVTVSVDLTTFDNERNATVKKADVTLTVTLVPGAGAGSPPGLDIASTVEGNFTIFVWCTVSEGAITGTVSLGMPTAQPFIEVSFAGSLILYDDAYMHAVEACMQSLVSKYKVNYFPTGRLGDNNPIDQLSQIVQEVGLPAYVRPSEYQRIRDAIKVMRAVNALYSPEQAGRYARSLMRHIPTFQALEARRAHERIKGRYDATTD